MVSGVGFQLAAVPEPRLGEAAPATSPPLVRAGCGCSCGCGCGCGSGSGSDSGSGSGPAAWVELWRIEVLLRVYLAIVLAVATRVACEALCGGSGGVPSSAEEQEE